MAEQQGTRTDEKPFDPKAIETKWQERWRQAAHFNVSAQPGREKYFVNFPYPYMNGFLHVGHSFSLLRLEFEARYQRMLGKNVLFPFSFHSTGMPIVAAAERVKAKEPKQLAILSTMGIPKEDIPYFEEAENWPRFFIGKAAEDLKRLGIAVDWSRSFTTTPLNPYYSRFIEWQFNKLKEGGFLGKGEFPVVWCQKDNSAVGDHARSQGEGVRPQEFTVLKFKTELPDNYFEDDDGRPVYLLAATLRPETVFGQTNLWLDPEGEYLLIAVDIGPKGELWVMSKPALEKFRLQKKGLHNLGAIHGKELVGRTCLAPLIHKEIPILPSGFCDPAIGTGIVSSVPSDAPDDWMGLEDLKKDVAMCEKYGLDQEQIKAIDPIPIISSAGWGSLPAKEICRKLGVRDQFDREKLGVAKKEIYRTGFYTGRMKDIAGEFAGMPVEFAKKAIMDRMLETGDADVLYELPESVVCRCLTPATVKIVDDQWFVRYSDEAWTEKTKKALEQMELFPALVRKQFEHVLDWLQDWACARMKGLGTPLPWEKDWLIESLSDSTIYMAFYTISRYFDNWVNMEVVTDPDHPPASTLTPEQLTDEFFDFLFLEKDEAKYFARKSNIPRELLEEMQAEFSYWYPFDLRGSGKDLIQNHLGFSLFHHTAIFPEKYWPKGFTLNGWIKVEGEKMSKSRGNFYTLRDMLDRHGADITRITLANAGEGINDPNLELNFAEITGKKLNKWFSFSLENYSPEARSPAAEDLASIDAWFLSRLNRVLAEVNTHMRETNFKSAIRAGFFDLQNDFRWYQRRAGEKANPWLVSRLVEAQAAILCPFVPHYVEELMSQLWPGRVPGGFASDMPYPQPEEKWLSSEAEKREEFFKGSIDDIRKILSVTGIVPERIVLDTAEDWMYDIATMLKDGEIKNQGQAMGLIMKEERFRKLGKLVPLFVRKFLPFFVENSKKFPEIDERSFYIESRAFLQREFGCVVEVYGMSDDNRYDPEGKSRATLPYRPGIFVK